MSGNLFFANTTGVEVSGSLTTAKAFAGNAAFFLAALVIANIDKIKTVLLNNLTSGKNEKEITRINQSDTNNLASVEKLIEKIAAEKFAGLSDKEGKGKRFFCFQRFFHQLREISKTQI